MKKILILFFIFVFITTAYAQTIDYREVCEERVGISFTPKTNFYPGEDPVEYYERFFRIMNCLREVQPVPPLDLIHKYAIWYPIHAFTYTSILNFARTTVKMPWYEGSQQSKCTVDAEKVCSDTELQCRVACPEDWDYDFRNKYGPHYGINECYANCGLRYRECQRAYYRKCEDEFEAYTMVWARELKVELDGLVDDPKDQPPESTPTEEFCGDNRCSIFKEFCFSCPQDCKCPPGTVCVDKAPSYVDTSKTDWVGCVYLNQEMQQVTERYRKNIDEISKLSQDRLILHRIFRQNVGRSLIRFVVFNAPKPTSLIDLVSEVTLSIIQETFFQTQELKDTEILALQRQALQKMNTRMKQLYIENRELRNKFRELRQYM